MRKTKQYCAYRKSDVKLKEWLELISALVRIILHVFLIIGLI